MKIQRRDEILRLLTENRIVKANQLAEQFQVSAETIRRDLSELEREGIARRTHGGAILNTTYSMEPDYSDREMKNFEEKVRIGKKAVEIVEDGDTIILDIGTTVLEFARMLKGKKKITVLTNSLAIAMTLMDDPNITVIVLGGLVRCGEGTTSGFWSEEMIDGFYADKLFLGVGAIETQTGVMDYDISETNLRRHFLKHSKQVIAMADYSKFGIKALNIVCPISSIDCVITDEQTDKKMVKELREQNIEVVIA